MGNKLFADRLHMELDKMDLPKPKNERIETFAKLISVPRFQAESILNGNIPSEIDVRARIAAELEVELDWLLGKED